MDAVQQKKMYVEREKLRAQLTLKELETPSNSIYQSVGKMFIVIPVDDVKKELNEAITQADVQIKDIEVKIIIIIITRPLKLFYFLFIFYRDKKRISVIL